MAADGMLLNFAVEDVPARNIQKFKGGSWRDRMRATRSAHGRVQRSSENPNAVAVMSRNGPNLESRVPGQNDEAFDQRPRKRLRQDGDHIPATSSTQNSAKAGGAPRQTSGRGPQKEVISSLFTYNPASTAAPILQEDKTDETPAKASNAPLVDGIDTFTSLGLSEQLATHLLTKMNLKAPTAIQKAAIQELMKVNGDAFIQSETGSGKTLAYLLPIVQKIATIAERQKHESSTGMNADMHRDSGLFAIVLAPTRELCKQIAVVLERVLGCVHFIVAGTVLGGEKKKSEKARLRKGLNILVATPGRLADHLDNTEVLDVSKVRWLVLDEGDRLMELGFEDDITKIVKKLDLKKRKSDRPGLPELRSTILCSATMKMTVQKLGEISLKDAVLIKGASEEEAAPDPENPIPNENAAFLAPAQLKQSYLVVPSKLRFVNLAALLRRTFARKGSVMKAIVFLSCADSVEFHYKAFTRPLPPSTESAPDATSAPAPTSTENDSISPSPQLSSATNSLTIFKLHGSLPQATRTSIVKSFSTSTTPSLLFATDVASRGLDLPNLDLVIEFDPAFSSADHLHRIGRTARLGRDGRAMIFLLPGAEEGYVSILRQSYKLSSTASVTCTDATDVLRKGFGPTTGLVAGKGKEWEAQATEFQLDLERWVLEDAANKELAKRAFQSHVRAYATHVAAERGFFDIRDLHLGHTAKSFGLRDAPGRVNVVGMGKGRRNASGKERNMSGREKDGRSKGTGSRQVDKGSEEPDQAARKMKEKVRNLGNKKMMMMGAGADEFNIA